MTDIPNEEPGAFISGPQPPQIGGSFVHILPIDGRVPESWQVEISVGDPSSSVHFGWQTTDPETGAKMGEVWDERNPNDWVSTVEALVDLLSRS